MYIFCYFIFLYKNLQTKHSFISFYDEFPTLFLFFQLMSANPDKRPTAGEALSNPWVQGNIASDTHLQSTVDRIKVFNGKRKFKVTNSN